MRQWLPFALAGVVIPVVLAGILALCGSLPLKEGVIFFPAAEISSTLLRKYAPVPDLAAKIFGPIAAPVPALLVVWSFCPDAEILELARMVLHWIIYLAYGTAMAFAFPFLEVLLGAPEVYPED